MNNPDQVARALAVATVLDEMVPWIVAWSAAVTGALIGIIIILFTRENR